MALLQLLVVLGAGFGLWVVLRNAQQQKRLETAFYNLLRQHDGCVSLIDLTAAAEVDTTLAKTYLDNQIRLLNAMPEVDDEGHTSYRFPKIQTPKPIVNDDWD
jgi:hypothetical protein